MGREYDAEKGRKCWACGELIYGDGDVIKKHAVICEFEKRTGLTVLSGDKGFVFEKGN